MLGNTNKEILKNNNMKKLIKHFGKNRDANKLYNLLYKSFSKKYYWYEVKFVYRDKSNSKILFDWKAQCGFKHQDSSLNKREVKKVLTPLHKDESIKKLLSNGKLDCELICFIGRFNSPL